MSRPSALAATLGIGIPEDLLRLALTHRSFAYEHGGVPHNERLEFLGDSVLGLVITDALYTQYPGHTEGDLARLRSAVVSATALAEVARALGLGEHLLLGRGEEITGGRDKTSILADAMEAVIGAVYVADGLAAAGELIHRLFDPLMIRAAGLGAGLDPKTSLQEAAAGRGLGVPQYSVRESGPDHCKHFVATVAMAGRVHGTGQGASKKIAEQAAARDAYEALTSGP